MSPLPTRFAILLVATVASAHATASELVGASPLTSQILLLHWNDGHVIHHKMGQRRDQERVISDPLDLVAAASPSTYSVQSRDDARYRSAAHPLSIGRKSKGTDFAWKIDRWVGDHAVNDTLDHTAEHWTYLVLPAPLKEGRTYSVTASVSVARSRTFRFDPLESRSEAVHVNTIGYAPQAPQKFGYLYHWMGDKGGLDVKPMVGRRFWLVDRKAHKPVFEGRVTFRRDAANPETSVRGDTPNANFLGADVADCDFSAFRRKGEYVLAVEGVGCSFPFTVDADIYRLPFQVVAKGLYYQRSGIPLRAPFSVYDRPAPGHPGVTPGFQLQYSSMPYLDYGSESGTREQLQPTLKGPLSAWGWYQDAGDWDSYETHLRVPQELLLAFEINPDAFHPRELNLPESSDGLPDILNEALWLPRFCQRLRAELIARRYGTGGIGLRVDGDPFGSDLGPGDVCQGSWQDTHRLWIASGEDAVSTFRYAGVAAQVAYCLQIVGKPDPLGVDWRKEAAESYAWAISHSRPKDQEAIAPHRLYAAAALFRLTGQQSYQEQVHVDARDAPLWGDNLYGPALFVLGGGKFVGRRDPKLLDRLRKALIDTADLEDASGRRRALRWAGDWGFPMLVGQQTTPMIMAVAVAWKLTGQSNYLADLYTTCDYFLGTNSLNMTWCTGLGPRHPLRVFHMDSWYLGEGTPHPGIIPYGPWRKEHDQPQGPWDHDWVNASVYPKIDQWPGNERWFDNRCTPLESEFTIHECIAPTAAIFGILCNAARLPNR